MALALCTVNDLNSSDLEGLDPETLAILTLSPEERIERDRAMKKEEIEALMAFFNREIATAEAATARQKHHSQILKDKAWLLGESLLKERPYVHLASRKAKKDSESSARTVATYPRTRQRVKKLLRTI